MTGECSCYPRDGVQRRQDNVWYELSSKQRQNILAAESLDDREEVGSGDTWDEDDDEEDERKEKDDSWWG